MEKTMENVRKHTDIKLVTRKASRIYVSEPKYHTTNFFSKNLLGIEIKRKQIFTKKKTVYLGLSILEFSKMYELKKQMCFGMVT